MNLRDKTEHELIEMLGPRLRAYLPADVHENPAIWVSQTFRIVASAVASGDTQAISLACDLIAQDPMLPFGKLVKSNLARALKKQSGKVIEFERKQVLATTAKLLNQEYAPRELEDYCKLVRKFPREEVLRTFRNVAPKNAKAEHMLRYLCDEA